MRRRRPSSNPATPENDWMGGANLERTQRDAMTQQHLIEMRQQAAQRSAWRPEVDAVGVIVRARQRVLHGTTHD